MLTRTRSQHLQDRAWQVLSVEMMSCSKTLPVVAKQIHRAKPKLDNFATW